MNNRPTLKNPIDGALGLPTTAHDATRRQLVAALAGAPALAVMGCSGSGSEPAADHPPLKLAATLPLGKAWASSSINVSVFREQSVLAVDGAGYLVVYVDDNGDVCLHQLTEGGATVRRVLVEPRMSAAWLADGHNSPSMGLAPDQTLHVMYGAHDTRPYLASLPLADYLRLGDGARLQAQAWPATISYPQFYTVGNTLQMWFRADPSNEVHRIVYDTATTSWPTASQRLLTPGSAERVYMNQLAVLGNRVALPWLYRLASTDDHVRNEGLWLALSADGGQTWANHLGAPITWPSTRGDHPPLEDVPATRQLLNQTSSRYGPDGRLYLTWYAKDNNNRHQVMLSTVGADGRLMGSESASDNTTVYDLLGRGTLVLPLSRPQLVVSARYIHVVYRQGNQLVVASRATTTVGAAAPTWQYLRLPASDLQSWEPSISAMHWDRFGKLVVYVQAARQGPLDTSALWPAQPAMLCVFTEPSDGPV